MPRTQLGAKVTGDGRPVVTISIIAICTAVWLLQQASPQISDALTFWPPAARSEPWRFLTAAFVHGPIYHILFNMFALWQVGGYLEPLLGRMRFAILYLVSAFGGSIGYLWLTSPQIDLASGTYSWTATVGASGAVFGLFGAMLVINRHLGRSSAGIAAVILINGVIGFLPGIAWQAHLGGLVTGAAMAALMTATSSQSLRKFQLPALAAVTVLLAVTAVARYAVLDNTILLSIGTLGA
jgi:membrane associated rhomboid family serine protease